ncbi:helix-turn-helix domain-containing protein [Halopseudomonas sp.]|uniref:helix-turn-helix domain-containing protein n=1 Tax=Halopseudomonas sp. TaxID=2901191 RepID=UPI0030018202
MKTAAEISSIKNEILAGLSIHQREPIHVSDKDAATVLGVKPQTLAAWRSTGRYDLPYFKIGRKVRYRITDLAEFLARSILKHTA